VDEQQWQTEQFELHRAHLQAVAYRMLGSLSEAEDAVQEAWLRLERTDAGGVQNLAAWLTTVVSRVCLDLLRSRAARREDLAGHQVPEEIRNPARGVGDPEQVTTKKLASRARQRVRGTPAVPSAELARSRRVVEAFLAASRAGDVDAVLAVLAPDVVRVGDRAALPAGRAAELRGARAVAEEIVVFGRNARFAEIALVNGAVGMLVAPGGRLLTALTFTIKNDQIAGYELIADPGRLRQLDLAVPWP